MAQHQTPNQMPATPGRCLACGQTYAGSGTTCGSCQRLATRTHGVADHRAWKLAAGLEFTDGTVQPLSPGNDPFDSHPCAWDHTARQAATQRLARLAAGRVLASAPPSQPRWRFVA